MVRLHTEFILSGERDDALRASLPPGKTPLHEHWAYYLRLMRET